MATPKASVSQITAGKGDIRISWSYPSGTDCVHIITSYGKDFWVYYNTSTTDTIDSPVFNQSIYWVQIIAHNSVTGDTPGWSDYTVFSLAPKPPPSTPSNITITKGTYPNFTVSFTKGSGAYYTAINKNWLPEGNSDKYIYTTASSYTLSVTSRGVDHWLQLASIDIDGIYSSWVWSPAINFPSRPSNFSGSLYKITPTKYVVDITQWKSFANKINEFRVYKGYSSYNFALANSATSGTIFTASHFNEFINGMSTICTGLPSQVYSGDKVYKSYLNALITSLNNVA